MSTIIDTGTTVAFVAPEHSWVLGKVTAYDVKTKTYTCAATEPEPITASKIKPGQGSIWAPRLEYLDEDVHDLLQLTELHEASLLFCLKRRYFEDIVYTNIGPILVALNPFNFNIPHYMDAKMPDYLSEGVQIERNLPHSWAVAHNTFYEMVENSQNQTILISGESGAGKTEAAKIVVKYLGRVSTLLGTPEQQEACNVVNKKVIAASPILEAFGNAKTVRNDNSSRFGKFAKIQFDRDGFLIGSFATKYLLEKSRIITAAEKERVYHSFYQLVFGPDHKDFGLRSSKLFGMLSSGNCETIEGVDDGADFMETKRAMEDVGMTADEIVSVWRTVAGILFFQNIEFLEEEDQKGKVSSIDEAVRGNLSRACDSWDLDEAAIERELLSTTITARGESTVRPNSKAQAQDTRDSVSRSLYDWLFEWIVNKINTTTDATERCNHWIGLLDIFGFEDFEYNSFEQLCINLANETLQNHYNHHIFTEDMRECQEEGIDTTAVQFIDNRACIDLLTGKIGILSLLDEECAVNGSIKNYVEKITANFQTVKGKEGHPFFAMASGKNKDNCFKIKHYAADVTYNVESFMDKNRDTLKDAMKLVLGKSNVPLIATIVPNVEDAKPSAKITVGGFFVRQLNELMSVINSTNPHWIRCIKPHPAKKPRMFSHLNVMTQLRSAGVLDTVKVRKAGYPIRFKRDLFLMRYQILIEEGDGTDPNGICDRIFKRLGITIETGQLGKTKVFLRQEAFTKLNHAKDEKVKVYALKWQAVGRASRERDELFREYVKMHRARILAERKAREEAMKRQREEDERRLREEEEARQRKERMEALRNYNASVALQRHVRGLLSRRVMGRNFIEELRAQEEKRCDDAFLRFRSYFDEVSARVEIVEEKYYEREKLQAVEAANEDMYAKVSRRRKVLIDRREERVKSIEQERAKRQLLVENEVQAAKAKQRADAEKKRKEAMEADQKARERRRHLLATKDGHEEQVVERLERRNQESTGEARAMVSRMLQNDEAMLLDIAEQRQRQNARYGSEFDRVKAEFVEQEKWRLTRETRFQQDQVLQHSRSRDEAVKQSLIASRGYTVAPNILKSPPNAASPRNTRPVSEVTGQSTFLRKSEMAQEARFRQQHLHQAHFDEEAEHLLRRHRDSGY